MQLSNRIQTQTLQFLRVILQYPTTALEFQTVKNFKLKFSQFFLKDHRRRHISKTTKTSAVTIRRKIHNPCKYSDIPQLQS